MSKLSEIAKQFREHYQAEDKLVRTEKWDGWHNPFAGNLKTVKNQNGILWLGECMNEFDRQGYDMSLFRDDCRFALDYLRIPGTYCYARRHGSWHFMESHDNTIATVLLAMIFQFDDINQGIVQWGVMNGWSYNNLDPYNEFDLRAARQPSAEALYIAAAGGTPGLLQLVWLIGAAINPGADIRKLYLRKEVMRRASARYKRGRVTVGSLILSSIFAIKGGRAKLLKVARDYYKDPDFTYRQLLEMPVR